MFFKCLTFLFFSTLIDAQYDYSYRRTCAPLHLDHGRVRGKSRAKLVKFMCSPRYELVGNRYATCRNGEWDVPTPVCVRPGCPVLPTPPNAIQMKEHLDAWVVTFCMPGYKLVGPTAVYCNGYKWNSTGPQCIRYAAVTNLSCDFEEATLCGWMQDELHDFDWLRLNKKTPSSFMETGPPYDHTLGEGRGGHYMYIESTSKQDNDTARLVSPIYDSSLITDGCFTFYFHMYGKGIGGLRVYQKPDIMQLSALLKMPAADRAPFVLFELWGNQGDAWQSAAPRLAQIGEENTDFQIVIEGIRGSSFTSDIAIDDVAILQGDNCSKFKTTYTTTPTPPPVVLVSCASRCHIALVQSLSCDCTLTCLMDGNCCPDFIELCVFNGTASSEPDDSSDEQPQTEKLVGVSTTSSPKPIITTPSTTTPAPTTQTTKLTTPTTKLTTRTTTLTKRTTKLTTKTTPMVKTTPSTTTLLAMIPTTKKPTKAVTTTTKLTTKLLVPTSMAVATKIVDSDEKKYEKEIKVQKIAADNQIAPEPSKWKTPIITIVILSMFASLVYLAVYSRTAAGRAALARLRGRASSNDSEVRYLTSDHDDL